LNKKVVLKENILNSLRKDIQKNIYPMCRVNSLAFDAFESKKANPDLCLQKKEA